MRIVCATEMTNVTVPTETHYSAVLVIKDCLASREDKLLQLISLFISQNTLTSQ